MDKIKINLIPEEIKAKAKKEAKQALVNKISIALLGLLIITTSGILATVIFQGTTLNSLNERIEKEKFEVQRYKDVEAVVNLLKNRIDTINQFSNKRYKQRDVFDLLTSLFPKGVSLQSLQIDKTTKVVVSGQTDETSSLKNLFDNLVDPKINEGKISSVTVNSLNRSQQGRINFEFNIHLAEGVL